MLAENEELAASIYVEEAKLKKSSVKGYWTINIQIHNSYICSY